MKARHGPRLEIARDEICNGYRFPVPHYQALRALGAKWLKIIFVMWQRQAPYDEQYHLATMTRQEPRRRQKEKIA